MKLIKALFFFSIILIAIALLGIIKWSTLGFIMALMIGMIILGFAVFIIANSFRKTSS
ncbi:MAG: hypothetical protein R3220_02465 [Balneolaceae bacterium]|nr:hypothetical protein [Balneolaceae bacterium]